jgi:hypothetical protein
MPKAASLSVSTNSNLKLDYTNSEGGLTIFRRAEKDNPAKQSHRI